MGKTGFIGFGSMNSMLIRGFLRTRRISPDRMVISTRTPSKAESLLKTYPDLRVGSDNERVARECTTIVLGVRPLEVLPLLKSISGYFTPGTHLISIAAGVRIFELERMYPGMITRIIPSLCSENLAGISLCCHNDRVDRDHAMEAEDLFGSVSRVIRLEETLFEPATDLMGCAPAIYAAILNEFAESGCRNSGLDKNLAYEIALRAFIGTGLLLGQMTPDEIIPRVATPGGITEEGVRLLREGLPSLFDSLFGKTGEKNEVLRDSIRKSSL